jgi:hypothetical protein
MGASDRLREAVEEAAGAELRECLLYDTGLLARDREAIRGAITAGVMTGLEHVELEGPRPYAEHAGEGEPALGPGWKAIANRDGSDLPIIHLLAEGDVLRGAGATHDGIAWDIYAEREADDRSRARVLVGGQTVADITVHPNGSPLSDETQGITAALVWGAIRAVRRDRLRDAGLPWPGDELEGPRPDAEFSDPYEPPLGGDEVERLRERVRELEAAGCWPEVMAVVEAHGAWDRGKAGADRALHKACLGLRNAVRSGKRCGLHPATVRLLEAVLDDAATDMVTGHVSKRICDWEAAGKPDLPREGGE